MATSIILLGDMHSGHKLGLCNPNTEIEDVDEIGTPVKRKLALTHTQIYLWDRFREHIEKAKSLIGKNRVIIFHGGDPTHGDKYPEQLLVNRSADQVDIAVANLSYLIDNFNVKAVRLIVGTASHSMSEYSSDSEIQCKLVQLYPHIDVKNLLHSLATIDDVEIDVAHHGPGPGIRQWTKGNVARYYLRSLVNQEIADDRCPPAMVFRFHHHDYIHEALDVIYHGTRMTSHIFVVASYCGLNHYARQVSKSSHKLTNGMVIVTVEKGRILDWQPIISTLDLRTRETL